MAPPASPVDLIRWPGNGNKILLLTQTNNLSRNNNNPSHDHANTSYVDVSKDRRYRLRIVNAASLSFFNIAIAGHNLSLISLGAMATTITDFRSFDLGSGERADFIIDTHNKDPYLYRIRIQTNWRGNDVSDSGVCSSAYLRYADHQTVSPASPFSESKRWTDQYRQVTPFENTDGMSQSGIDETHVTWITINVSQSLVDRTTLNKISSRGNSDASNYFLRWTQNSRSYRIPSEPLLLTAARDQKESSYLRTVLPESRPIHVTMNTPVRLLIQSYPSSHGVCEVFVM